MDWEEVELSLGNINQGHFYLPKSTKLFPINSWGGNNKTKKGTNVKVIFSGIEEYVLTDIDSDKRILREARGQSKRFIKHYGLQSGDKLYIYKTGDRQFRVSIENPTVRTVENINIDFEKKVKNALEISSNEREILLANAVKKPEKVIVSATIFRRNPYVVAEVLLRANGVCERCGKDAPFNRQSDRTPYLEVHHKTPLSQDGDDTIENAIALCPNCHRELHFG